MNNIYGGPLSWAAFPQKNPKPTLQKVRVPAVELLIYASNAVEAQEAVLSGIKLQIEEGFTPLNVSAVTSEADIPEGWSETAIPFSPEKGPAANTCQRSVGELLRGEKCRLGVMLGACECCKESAG
ncbi:hypothetical protein [Archangium lansingense]|uniref:Uncharacterized protein n=1 Tax=Archangium lansingense TaxID=2995310 RepID=A0ABT3ZV47_9BACT|nr:hypothetical protein [Archangium lansinium]MCY1073181.1 hypothetical protein [Archangium lansinium]